MKGCFGSGARAGGLVEPTSPTTRRMQLEDHRCRPATMSQSSKRGQHAAVVMRHHGKQLFRSQRDGQRVDIGSGVKISRGGAANSRGNARTVPASKQRANKAPSRRLTCRPALAEALCCFLDPSAPVLPPELFPPEDFPLPPGIVYVGRRGCVETDEASQKRMFE